MRKIISLLTTICLVITLYSCGRVSQQEYDTLKAENEALKKEIDELKFGAERLFAEAKTYFKKNELEKARLSVRSLQERHPASTQATESNGLLTQIEIAIKERQEAERKEKEVKEKAEREAQAAKEKAERERLANATKKLRTSHDDVRDITWYYDKGTPYYSDVNSFHMYMGKSSGTPWLRFRIQYAADDWLFIEKYIIKTDNNSYTISAPYGEVERDNGYGGIWEWYDVALTDNLYKIVKDVISSKSVKIRHEGSQYYKDRTISAKEKQGLQNILDAYEALGGTFTF
jgi:hypothetical protein